MIGRACVQGAVNTYCDRAVAPTYALDLKADMLLEEVRRCSNLLDTHGLERKASPHTDPAIVAEAVRHSPILLTMP